MIEEFRKLIEKPTPNTIVNKFFTEKMPELTALPNIAMLNKNNHLILNFAGLEYPGMYAKFNILYLDWLPQGPSLFLHIPYLIILSDEQVRRQSSGIDKQIILYNDELINNNYVNINLNNHQFQSFYREVIEKYKVNIQTIWLESSYGKDKITRPIVLNIIDSLFQDANFLIKIYLFIYEMTKSIPQAPLGAKENNMDAILEILKQHLNNIFIKIDFSILGGFNLPQIPLDYPPEPLPPPLANFAAFASANSDINLEILRLLCPYKIPQPGYTPDRILTLLTSPVY